MSDTSPAMIDVQTDPAQPSTIWYSLWDGRKWKREADSKRIDITSALVGLVISTGIIGFWLPLGLNSAAVDRDNVQRCWDAAIEVRKTVNTAQDGFIVQPSSPVPRRADLRSTQIALQNAKFACIHVAKVADLQPGIDSFIDLTASLMSRSDAGDFRTRTDFEATGFVVDVSRWVDDSLRRLTS